MCLIVRRDEEHLVASFAYFDKYGSGYITVEELWQACVEHNMTDILLSLKKLIKIIIKFSH
ncbi:hypothetical protein MKX03_037057, partial [Papaver bracteatum]